ncbi:MAG TPA: hemerythrin domain-containing protein [Burkholderiaceae bacterium]|nr:hemerythrin domain-containing protein [Burkholderiaceae bacterium]
MESITSHMQQDHVLIDGFAERAATAAETAAWPDLEREGGEFLRRLRRHIEMEEEVLFPAFEQRTGMVQAGPSVQMRMEHEQMQPILEQMQAAIAARDGAGYRRAAHALLEILVPHNQKEEQMMYPMLDQAVGDEAQALLTRVKAMAV